MRNLVSNPYFREQLPEADYAALVEAQRLEFDAVDYVNRYFANYGTISELAEAYAAAQAEADAAEIYDKYKTLQGFNRVLADSLSDAWNYIFDNKSYAYGYLMDKLGAGRDSFPRGGAALGGRPSALGTARRDRFGRRDRLFPAQEGARRV